MIAQSPALTRNAPWRDVVAGPAVAVATVLTAVLALSLIHI